MERVSYKEFMTQDEEKKKPKKLGKGSIVRIKGRHKIDMISSYGTFGSLSLTGAIVTEKHKFPKSEFTPEDEFLLGGYVTNDNEYEVQDISKTGNAVVLRMAGKEVLVFKKCIEVVQ